MATVDYIAEDGLQLLSLECRQHLRQFFARTWQLCGKAGLSQYNAYVNRGEPVGTQTVPAQGI